MTIRWLLATVHLLALPIGFAAVLGRARALRGELDPRGLRRVFNTDAVWGIAAILWISTGLIRAFGGFEKGSAYYLGNHMFWLKMSLLGGIIVLEVWPMTALIRWRSAARRGGVIDTRSARSLARVSVAQAVLVVLMVFAATAMARGLGY